MTNFSSLFLLANARNLHQVEKRMQKLSQALSTVDNRVAELRNNFETLTKEAAELKMKLDKENETIQAAETLVSKLEGEYQRWNNQVKPVSSSFFLCIWKCVALLLKRNVKINYKIYVWI